MYGISEGRFSRLRSLCAEVVWEISAEEEVKKKLRGRVRVCGEIVCVMLMRGMAERLYVRIGQLAIMLANERRRIFIFCIVFFVHFFFLFII